MSRATGLACLVVSLAAMLARQPALAAGAFACGLAMLSRRP
jgi:hypothetical protein